MAEVIIKTWGAEAAGDPASAGDWRAIMCANLELPATLDDQLRELWDRNKAAIPDALNFARMAADKLFKDVTG